MRTTDTHVYFVGGYLSNWHKSDVEFCLTDLSKPWTFNCTEQIYMAYKALMFNDFASLEAILQASNPREQKRLGREIRNFDALSWNLESMEIMYKANLAKFRQHPKLARELIETGDRTIVEAAWYDTIWGVGLREDDDKILDEKNWLGTNWLGKTLMLVRNAIR